MPEDITPHEDAAALLRAMVAELAGSPGARLAGLTDGMAAAAAQQDLLIRAGASHARTISATHTERLHARMDAMHRTAELLRQRGADGTALATAFGLYLRDAFERWVLTLDTLRERGDIFRAHEAAGCPPVLIYEHEIVMDGADLPRSCNYQLLCIPPPEGVEIDETRRPYVIIDPRAGHGGGIGGFKKDSQVGVALAQGHPVYFVNFRRDPVPGQTLADVTRAEAAFVREVMRRHPDSPAPVVTGNCQGGWATLLLAATNPDLTGPIVLNGAPVTPWAGEVGRNPMRYNAGILGGTWQPMFMSDLGGGVFDGAHLVQNFEMLNPGRNFFSKYDDLFADPERVRARFLEFERWWGGFFLLNEAEIRWIVEQLFVGNRLVKNVAQLEPGRPVDLKRIGAPVIVFTSRGDNITPPQQALNWIVDTYADEEEIRIRGQRIIYMLHEEVGHLGIFVSSKIAQKEHTEVASTMRTIEALAPGLYEMKIDAVEGEGLRKSFLVSFAERGLDDIRALDDGREDELSLAAVARASEVQTELYETFLRPVVRSLVSAPVAAALRAAHPLRVQRAALASSNPAMGMVANAAGAIAANRRRADPDNPFLQAERMMAGAVTQWFDMGRDIRDAIYEMTFFALWGTPWARAYGERHAVRRTVKTPEELHALPEVRMALMNIARGGFVEAVIRMLVLLAESRGNVRRDRLERSSRVLTRDEPFRALGMEQRARIIHEQTLVATFDPEGAVRCLPDLLPDPGDRELAAAVAQYVPGPIDEMAPHTLETLQRFRRVLGLGPLTGDVTEDPLADSRPSPAQPRIGAVAQ